MRKIFYAAAFAVVLAITLVAGCGDKEGDKIYDVVPTDVFAP